MVTRKILVSLSLTLTLGSAALAEERLPCGVVTKSIKLTASCNGPMIIAANNITIDLAGHTVGSDDDDSILMKDRSGVEIKNGSVGGRGALRIEGGKNNSLRDLSIGANEDGGPLVIDTKNAKLQRITFRVDTDASGVYIGGRGTTVSDSTFQTFGDARGGPLLILGAGAAASRNSFVGAAQGAPSLFVETGARAESNTIEWESQNVYPPGQNLLAAVVVRGDGAIVRSNSIRISAMKDDSYSRIIGVRVDGSRNTIKNNTIIMSAPEVASVGVFISPGSKNDMIHKNRVSLGDSQGDVGIHVLGSRCKIIDNKTDSVVMSGSYNISRRNGANVF